MTDPTTPQLAINSAFNYYAWLTNGFNLGALLFLYDLIALRINHVHTVFQSENLSVFDAYHLYDK